LPPRTGEGELRAPLDDLPDDEKELDLDIVGFPGSANEMWGFITKD